MCILCTHIWTVVRCSPEAEAVDSVPSGSAVALLGVVGEEEEGTAGGTVATEGVSSVGAVVSGPGVVLGSGVTTVGIGVADGSR